MTTIASDGRSIAADRLITSSEQLLGETTKVYTAKDGSFFASAGNASDCDCYEAWKKGTLKERPDIECDSFEAMILRKNKVYLVDKNLIEIEVFTPQAIGSGGNLALGAMLAGATPQEAIEFAAERDLFTGGGVDVLPSSAASRD